MPEHHGRAEDHRRGVGAVGALDVTRDMTASGLEKGELLYVNALNNGTSCARVCSLTLPTLQPGTIPGPPTSAAPMLDTIAPYRLGMTMTSNCDGRATSCIDLRDERRSVPKLGRPKIRASLRVVDNHVIVLDAGALVVLRDAAEGVEEETVTELHDVRLVDTSDFL